MSCNYWYKGRLIGDIRKLDDFLLERKPYEKQYGDQVFLQKGRLLYSKTCLDKVLQLASELNAKYAEAKRNAKQFSDTEEILRMTRPYVGVSEFLSGQKDENGQLYFPEFVESEYWSRRYLKWSNGEFTEDEAKLFFNDPSAITPVALGNINDWRTSDGKLKNVNDFGTDEQKRLRGLMEDKWKHQAEYGTEIHNVLLGFFSKNDKGKSWFEILLNPTTGAMQRTVFERSLRSKKVISNNLRTLDVNDIIDYAINLKKELHDQFGENLEFYPEFTLHADLNKTYEGRDDLKILGRADLLILDENGYPHVIDYKTSPKPYEDYTDPTKGYSVAKLLGFTYQLSTYERMLRRAGLNTSHTRLVIAPLKMENFRKEGNRWVFDKVVKGTAEANTLLKDLTDKTAGYERLSNNLDEFIEAPLLLEASTNDVISNVTLDMAALFPRYGDNRKKTTEQIRDMVRDLLGDDWINKESGKYEFTPKGSHKIITLDDEGPGSEAKFIAKIEKWYNSAKENNVKTTVNLIKALREALSKGIHAVKWPDHISEWTKNTLSKYLEGNWEIMSGTALDAAEQFGMILMYNPMLDLMDVVKISNGTNLKYMNTWNSKDLDKKGIDHNLLGAHESDNIENSRSDSLMLKAANGNIEMIEAMLVLNNLLPNTHSINLGNIKVINPSEGKYHQSSGLTARNKELMYSWKRLLKYRVDKTDNFSNGQIKMLSDAELCYQEFENILNQVGTGSYGTKYDHFKPAVSKLHDALIPNKQDVELAIDSLQLLRKLLEEKHGMNIDLDTSGKSIHLGVLNYSEQYEKILYQRVTLAILDLNDILVRQMLQSHGKYFDGSLTPKNLLTNGWQGYEVDNANNFANLLINQVTNIVLEGYQNARDRGYRQIRELRNDVEKLKRDSGYNKFVEYTIGNQTSLYEGMTKYTADGDLLFVNPWLHPEILGNATKVEFLKKAILKINENVHPDMTLAEIDNAIRSNDPEFFLVPLIEGTFASKVNTDGWTGWLKNKFKIFKSWDTLKTYLRDKQSEFLSDDLERLSKNDAEIFQAVNLMDQGSNRKTRLDIIARQRGKYGDGYFERDLERIIGTHIWAYATHDALENRIPLLKSAFISLAIAGNDLNYTFENEIDYFKKFVKNKVKKESIVDDKAKTAKGAINVIQRATSWMALALSPVLFTYQSLEGIWKDAKLFITKPDGTLAFTFENLKKAAGIVYQDLGHMSDDSTITSGINAVYGINDMDANSFVENNSSNNHGIFNFFSKFAMKMSSRPDYYNRMTIFTSLMLKDGSWKAHKIDKNNLLIYNWKEDDRFKAYALDPSGKNGKTEEWLKAKALYYATAKQLVREGASDIEGNLFKINSDLSKPNALPKAYSNKESEAMKAVGDTMYGYYDSTKKSIMQGGLLGGLFMQMRTFWSGKKNQYLGYSGHKAQGEWNIMKDPVTGKELYYSKDADGNLDSNAPLVTKDDPNCSGVAFMQWKGKFEEGVLLTLFDIMRRCYHNGTINIKSIIDERAAGNEDVRKTLISNIKLFITDIVMLVLIGSLAAAMGDWAEEAAKEAKKSKNIEDSLYATFAGIAARSVKNSSLDFAWWNAILEPSMDWNPFAISYLGNEAAALTDFITGDATAALTIVKSFSAARQMRPIFTYLDQLN